MQNGAAYVYIKLIWSEKSMCIYVKSMWQGEKENVFDVVCVQAFCISNWELCGIINTHDFPHRRCYFAAGQTVLFSWQKQMYQGSLNLDLKVWTAAWYLTALWFYRLLATHHSNFSVFFLGMQSKCSPCSPPRLLHSPPCPEENKPGRVCHCQVIFNNLL